MAKIRNAVHLEQVMTARLFRIQGGVAKGMKAIRDQAHSDLIELTSGSPQGTKTRQKWLRQQGRPFGRGQAAALSTPASGKRRGKRPPLPKVPRKSLPIGVQSGNLRSAAFATVNKNLVGRDTTRITVGFNKRAGKSILVVLPFGTKRMVARGLFFPGENGAMGKRVKAYRQAFYYRYIRGSWKSPS